MIRKQNIKRILAVCCAISAAAALCTGSVSAMFSSSYLDTGTVEMNILADETLHRISPYIYGLNAESGLSDVRINAVKQSDPRVSSYNWENNYSNSGSGNGSENSLGLVEQLSPERQSSPALYTENLIARAGRYSVPSKYATLQMMGKVAPDSADKPWETVMFSKNDSYLSSPDTEDGIVYMDEYVSFLVNSFGYAIDGGINGYFLDNEPENWSVRFPTAVPSPISAEELVSRSAELAYSVKKIDPTALIYGPSVNGIDAFINIKNPSDQEKYMNEYSWFIDYYLDEMKKASDEHGTRLLDVLDIHYHTEATNGLLQPIINGTDALSDNVRAQAPRILWDSTYTENSNTAIMHNQYIPLIPTLKASIDMYYPGTKLSFSEYDFGGGANVSGGIAAADVLGIFAKYDVHMACMKPSSADISYLKAAMNIYTDYDGNGSRFGSMIVDADNGGDIMSSVYASVDDNTGKELTAVLINKNRFDPKTAEINITSDTDFHSAKVWFFDEESAEIRRADDITDIENNSLSFEMSPLAVYMLVFDSAEIAQESVYDPENTETSAQQDTVTSVTTEVPEHVDASTYSSAGTSLTADGTSAAQTQSEVSLSLPTGTAPSETVPSDETESSVSSSASENDNNEDKAEHTVPRPIKAAVSLLVAAVVIALIYVIISDFILSKKNKK